MPNKLIYGIYSSLVYFKVFLISFVLFCVIIIILVDNASITLPLIVLYFFINAAVLYFLGRKRTAEINEVSAVIKRLRTEEIKNEAGILLSSRLNEIQYELKELFVKNKGIIEYLQRLERMRTEFLANTSHELRTPLFAIQGFIETLLNGALEDPNVNRLFLEKANRHTHNLNNLVNDLIDISMIESGEMRMHFRYFDINEFISSLVEEFKPLASEKKLYLNFIPSSKKLALFGDKEKIRQALSNLIQNAIKYTDSGGIEVKVEEEQRFGKIIVKDTGIGIPEEDINRIFERFYRVDKGRSRDIGGTGLGLAIVKHITEAHNSKIEVKSVINRGSEFSFRLKK